MTENMESAGLGGMFNLVLPPFIGLISIITYLFICWITNDKVFRTFAIIACCLYLFYVGLIFQLRPGYLPFPL